MSTPKPPPSGPSGAAKTGAGQPGTVGVYDRPAAADKPSNLPKIITAVIVVAMLVLTYLFWPKSTAPSTRDAAPPAATSAPATTPGGGTGSTAGTDATPGSGSGPGTGTGGSSATTTSK